MKNQVKTILCSITIALISCYSPEKINSQFINELNPFLEKIHYHIDTIYSENSIINCQIKLNKKREIGFNKEQHTMALLIARKYLKSLKKNSDIFAFKFYSQEGKHFLFYQTSVDLNREKPRNNWIQEFMFQHLLFSSYFYLSSYELYLIDLLFSTILNVYEKDFILNCDFIGLLFSISELFTPLNPQEKWYILSQHDIFMEYVTQGPYAIDGKKFIFMNRFTDYALAKLQGK